MPVEILSRWKMRKINSNVPLYDPVKRTYMIIVDSDTIDVPEDIFLKLFKRVEAPLDGSASGFIDLPQEESKTSSVEEFRSFLEKNIPKFESEAADIEHKMRAAMRFYLNLGLNRESIIELLTSQARSKFSVSETYISLIRDEVNKIIDEIEGEKK